MPSSHIAVGTTSNWEKGWSSNDSNRQLSRAPWSHASYISNAPSLGSRISLPSVESPSVISKSLPSHLAGSASLVAHPPDSTFSLSSPLLLLFVLSSSSISASLVIFVMHCPWNQWIPVSFYSASNLNCSVRGNSCHYYSTSYFRGGLLRQVLTPGMFCSPAPRLLSLYTERPLQVICINY